MAEAVGVERSTVMRWERGETRPQPWARPKLARALGISDQALSELLGETTDFHTRSGSGMPEEPVEEVGCDPVLSASWNQQGTVIASIALKGVSPMNRRRFTLLTGAALTVPAHQWLVRDPEPLVSGLLGGRVSAALTDQLPAMIATLRAMDDAAGGGTVLSLAQLV
ncbi:MAG: helix-turn-helix transcriptional regulator, partial [Pseudonocardiaceae bacterium]